MSGPSSDIEILHKEHTTSGDQDDGVANTECLPSSSNATSSRPTRNRKPSELSKQNKVAMLSVELSKTVNRNLQQLENLYTEFDRLETVAAVDDRLEEVENAAQVANDLYDEWFLLSDNKPVESVNRFFDQYMKEVRMVANMLEEKNKVLNEAEREAAEEEIQISRLEASIQETQEELAEQIKIYEERLVSRERQRLQAQEKMLQQTRSSSRTQHTPTSGLAYRSSRATEVIQSTPVRTIQATERLEAEQSHFSSSDRSLQAIEHLANSLVSTMKSTKRSTLDPEIFTGNPLEFADWEIDLNAYINSEGLTGLERLRHLKKFVGGDAKESISGYFKANSEESYELARQHLRQRFGKKHSVARAMRSQLDEWPRMRPRDGKQLQKFADFLKQISQSMGSVPDLYILNDSQENEKMAYKLPDVLQFKWAKRIRDTRKAEDRYPTFREFAEFIDDEAELLAEPILDRENKSEQNTRQKPKSEIRNYSTSASPNPHGCLFCNKGHLTGNCFALESKPYEERVAFVREHRLCWSCLCEGHRTISCNKRMSCRTCQKPHPSSLHRKPQDWKDSRQVFANDAREPSAPTKASQTTSSEATKLEKKETTINTLSTKHLTENTQKFSMVLPVYLSTAESVSETLVYALLDTQSDSCFISRDVASILRPKHVTEDVSISTLTGVSTGKVKRYQDVRIRAYFNTASTTIDAYERREIPCNRLHIPTDSNITHLKYLDEIKDKLPPPLEAPIGLLIGTDCPEALTPLTSIQGEDGKPFAIETMFGWTVCGGKRDRTSIHADKVSIRANASFVEQVCEDVTAVGDEETVSQDDLKFMEILDQGTVQTNDGSYQMPLPFRNRPTLPDNCQQAEKRMQGLMKRFAKDQAFKKEYTCFMEDIITQNQAEVVTEPDNATAGEVWYIPHFAVTHPKKNKLRVVFDCKARFQDTSLNDLLLQGPDSMNSLLGILCRFRRESVAMCCDIQKMFYNFYVNEEDRDYLRFLWIDSEDQVKKYRMKVHLFGATSSPAVATYGLRKIANDYREISEEAANFIERDFYVDDGITSVNTTEKAVQLIENARAICDKGNLRLHKITSNSKEVLQAIPESERSIQNVDLVGDKLPNLRTLGLEWSTSTDSFLFTNQIKQQPDTRRGVLSVISQLYDPLGFIAPFTLLGKNILQKINQAGLQWDEEIGTEFKTAWSKWMGQLKALEGIRIPRCVKPPGFEVQRAELHHFSDASEQGTGACSYLRLLNADGKAHVTLLLGKSRVVPSKGVITIPRLELMAAVQAVQLSLTLRKELDMNIDEEFFYTDSQIVMGYIANDAKRFHVFVANRVRQIRTHTKVAQWYHVPGQHNPADIASRGLECTNLMASIWFSGPTFLHQKDVLDGLTRDLKTTELDHADPEVKQIKTLQTTATPEPRPVVDRFEKCDSWTQLKRVVANLQQVDKQGWRKHRLEPDHLMSAELCIIRTVQEANYSAEILALQKEELISKNSSIAKLSPYLDKDSILRVGGRVRKSSVLSSDEKHPAILPQKEHVSRLLVQYLHAKTHHQGSTITLSAIRGAGYWITGLTRVVKSVIHDCITCRKMRGRPSEQKMADLPSERTEPSPPFTHIGMDCFGPFTVKDRRSEIKRWGLLLTCLYSRAVHIEMLENMSTDSLLNALRSFICLRGPVKSIRCDQGTNFVGARNELDKQLEALPPGSDMERYFREHHIEFKFNPPHASHMGGVWERQIRTVRSVLNGMSEVIKSRLDTPGLRSAFYEAMAIVNSRPLTPENLSNPTEMIVTPNHLITMKPQQPLPPGPFEATDLYSRKMWRRVQSFAEEFWCTWKAGYLNNITKRQRWTEEKRNLRKGDVVLIADNNQPRNEWSTAIVEDVVAGSDDLVRRAKVRLANRLIDNHGRQIEAATVLERPVQKLILLLPNNESEK